MKVLSQTFLWVMELPSTSLGLDKLVLAPMKKNRMQKMRRNKIRMRTLIRMRQISISCSYSFSLRSTLLKSNRTKSSCRNRMKAI